MAAFLGFIEESHEKLKQWPALYQTSLLYKNKILLIELKPENKSKIIMLVGFSLEFTTCFDVELSHKKANFAIPTYLMKNRTNISS